MLQIKEPDYEKIISYAKEHLPEEACGLVAGCLDGGVKKIKKIYFLTNTDKSSTHYFMDINEQLAAVRDMRKHGLALLGSWHSHPDSPAGFSEEDRRFAYDSSISYLILSLMHRDEPQFKSYTVSREKEVTEEPVILEKCETNS